MSVSGIQSASSGGDGQHLPKRGIDHSARRALKTLILALAYCLTGALGLLLAVPPGYATAVWPPSGIALAGLLKWGWRVWPGIWAGSFLVNVWVSLGASSQGITIRGGVLAASIAVGSTLQALLGAFLLRRLVGVDRLFERGSAILSFVIIEALSCLVAATWGVCSMWLAGILAQASLLESWRTWWLGDLVGVLLITPALLTWRQVVHMSRRPWKLAEVIASFALLALVAGLVFVGWSHTGGRPHPLAFLPMACLVWIAYRHEPGEAALASCLLSAIALVGTCAGEGPFLRRLTYESLFVLQAFTGLTAVVALVLAAEVSAHRRAETSLRSLNIELERQALTDELTNLRNRRGFLLLADQAWRIARRSEKRCWLVYVDLDGLKPVNDTHGHAAGDALLVDSARVLAGAFRESDVIGRIGGDEFAVLVVGDPPGAPTAIGERLQQAVRDFNQQAVRPFALSLSIGIEDLSGAGDTSLDALLVRADQAMYAQKRRRRPSGDGG